VDVNHFRPMLTDMYPRPSLSKIDRSMRGSLTDDSTHFTSGFNEQVVLRCVCTNQTTSNLGMT